MDKQLFNVGDYVWSIMSFRELYGIYRHKKQILKHPHRKKITQVVFDKNGVVSYQVKGGHFTNNLVGIIIFKTEIEAIEAISKGEFKYE